MSANKSTNKISVTKLPGGSAVVGKMEPLKDMSVRHGNDDRFILSMNADHSILTLSKTMSGVVVSQAYPEHVTIAYAAATGYWSYPTGTLGSGTVLGHGTGIRPHPTTGNGFAVNMGGPVSGFVYGQQ